MAASVSALKVPTIFTAVDKYTTVVTGMSKSTTSFVDRAQIGIARVNRAFRSVTPVFGEAGRQLLDAAKTAAIAGAVISGIIFSKKSLMDYEKQLASFRTIVSDLSNKDFKVFQSEIKKVANDSKGLSNTVEVAASFEKIAGLNSKFAETANGLGLVSKATITLSKASGDDLSSSAESLVGIMNQYSLGADQANRTINVLAAGQAVGAASITQTSDAFVNFGSVAKSSNITLEESVGLIQTLGKFSIFGAEAGTKLRGVTLKLQQAGAGYASGQFNINDALAQVSKKYDKLSTQRAKDSMLLKIFGAENISVGKTLLNNISTFQEYTKGVTGTSEAQKAAAINSDTLGEKVTQLQNKWINYITTNDQVSGGMSRLKGITQLVIDNFAEIITVGSNLLIILAGLKVLIMGVQAAMWLYNIALGVNAIRTGVMTEAILLNKTALIGAKVAVGAATAFNWLLAASVKGLTVAQWALNVAMSANPIALIVIAIAALIALVVLMIIKWDEWGAALSLALGPLGMIISLIQSFRRNWEMVTKAFKEDGILSGLIAIGKTILDSVIQPIEQLLSIIGKITGFDWASNAAKSLSDFRGSLGVNLESESDQAKAPLSNPQIKSDEITRNSIQKNILDINFNDPNGTIKSTNMKGPLMIPVQVSSTQGSK